MSLLNQIIVSLMPLMPKGLVKPFARRYVAGESMEEMLGTVRRFHHEGIFSTVDLLGEFIHQKEEALASSQAYKDVLKALYNDPLHLNTHANISIKLSAMGLLLDKQFCYDVVRDLVATAKEFDNFVRIDMEDTPCTSDTIAIYLKLREEFTNVGIVLQAYLRRTLGDARQIIAERAGHFRLCKGIYVEPRSMAFKDHRLINKNYALVLEEMFRSRAYVGIATHNEELVWEAMRLIDHYKLSKDDYEFQMLLGVDPELRQIIVDGGHKMRVYVPFGKDWYAYSLRRLKENPSIAGHILKNMLTPGDYAGDSNRRS